jgi:hypothetical protein
VPSEEQHGGGGGGGGSSSVEIEKSCRAGGSAVGRP